MGAPFSSTKSSTIQAASVSLCNVNNDNQPKTNTTMTTAYLNEITRQLTTFASFADLVSAGNNYRPSIYFIKGDIANRAKCDLANAYDDAQQMRGDERRAYRTTE